MRRLLALLVLLAAAPVLAQPVPEDRSRNERFKSDWELEQEKRDWTEGEVKLPAFPAKEGLVEFFVSAASNFRFYIDAASLNPGADGVVRYVLVARSPSGYSNISYEGIRCATNAYKVYALGNDGNWTRSETEWREIEPKSVQRWHVELRSRYFCPGRVPIATVAEGRDALRRGGHPAVSGKSGSER